MTTTSHDAGALLAQRFPGAYITCDTDRYPATGLWGAEIRVEMTDGSYVRASAIAATKESACEMVARMVGASLGSTDERDILGPAHVLAREGDTR